MKRIVAGVAAGVVGWFALLAIGGAIIRSTWPAYAAVADEMAFTLPMLLTRLALSAVTLLAAARLTAAIAPGVRATLILGVVLLIMFIPIHINLWDRFPVWYHLTFLLTLVPLSLLGGKLGAVSSRSAPLSSSAT